jgi:hypothetical protein
MTSLYDRPNAATTSGLNDGNTSAVAGFDFMGAANKGLSLVEGVYNLTRSFRASKMPGINERNLLRIGEQSFNDHMSQVKQTVASYVQSQAGSGLARNKDIEMGAYFKGSRDAAQQAYEYDLQAGQQRYEGRIGKIQARMNKVNSIASGVKSISSAFMPV